MRYEGAFKELKYYNFKDGIEYLQADQAKVTEKELEVEINPSYRRGSNRH